MGICGRWARGLFLGVGLSVFPAVGAQAQDWGENEDVVIQSPTAIWVPWEDYTTPITGGQVVRTPEEWGAVTQSGQTIHAKYPDYYRADLFPLSARSLTLNGKGGNSFTTPAFGDDLEYSEYSGGYLHLFGCYDAHDLYMQTGFSEIKLLQVGEGGILVEDGGHLRIGGAFHLDGYYRPWFPDGWVDSTGGVKQTGGTLSVGLDGILSTGWNGNMKSFSSSELTGTIEITGGDFNTQGRVLTGQFSASGNGSIRIGEDLYVSQGIHIQSDHLYVKRDIVYYEPDKYGPGEGGFDGLGHTLVGGENGVSLSGVLHLQDYSDPIFTQYAPEIHEVVILKSFVESADETTGIRTIAVDPNGTLHVVGDLAITGGDKRFWDMPNGGAAAALLVAPNTILHAGTTLTVSPDAYDDVSLSGTVQFEAGAEMKVDGLFLLGSYKPTHSEDDDEIWTLADGVTPIDEFRLDSTITAAAGNTALITIGQNGQLDFGFNLDMNRRFEANWPDSVGGATLTLAAPTVIQFDYNAITGYNEGKYDGEKKPQIGLGTGGRLEGVENLTLAINAATAPVLAVGAPAQKAYLVKTIDSPSVEQARGDLEALGLAKRYQYGLYFIDDIAVELVGADEQDPYVVTGMVGKLSASGAMSPGLAAAGIVPTSEMLDVFDNYTPGTNSYVDILYEGIASAPAASYAGLAAGVNADAVVGGASVAVQSQSAAHANVSGRMTGATAGGNVQAAAASSFSEMAFARIADEGVTADRWTPGFGLWIAPLYTHAKGKDINVGGVKGGYSTDLGGGTLGFDYTTCDGAFRFGVAGNLGGGNSDSKGGWTRAKNDFTFGGVELYAGAKWNNFTFMVNGGWSRNANELKSAAFSTAKYDTDIWSVGASAEYRFELGCFNFIPGFAVEYANVRQDAFALNFAAAPAFRNGKGTADVLNLPVSLRVNRNFQLAKGVLTPEINGAWIPSVKDKGINYNTTIMGPDTVVSANSLMMDRNTGQVGAGLKFDTARYTIGAEYQYRFSNHYDSHNLGAVFRLKF